MRIDTTVISPGNAADQVVAQLKQRGILEAN
jgi:hypothetical protein